MLFGADVHEKRAADFDDARAPLGFPETAPFVGIHDAGLGGDAGPIGWSTYAPALALALRRGAGAGCLLYTSPSPRDS